MEQCGNSHPGFLVGFVVRMGSAFMWEFFFADPIRRILIVAAKKNLTRPTFC